MVITINKAEYLKGHTIRLLFSDGVEQTIDFSKFLEHSRNPMTRKYLDKKEFSEFSVAYGDLMWNDFEMCFPIWDLHEGKI